MRIQNRIAIFFCLLIGAGCADRWLIYPSNSPIDPHGAVQLTIENSNRKIEIFTAKSPGAQAAEPLAFSLNFCGNSGRAEQIATQLANQWGSHRVEVWVMNYPGFGNSDGPASLQLFPHAALATYDQLKKRARHRPIFVNGFSLGTTVALYVAAHRPAAGMILQSPPPLQREIMWHYGWWNLWMVASVTALDVPGALNSLCNAPNVTAPAVFILTGADTIVPIDYQRMVYDSYKGIKHQLLMPNAEHNAPISPSDQFRIQREREWLWNESTGKR